MDRSQLIDILRHRTAIAILNHCKALNGNNYYRHKGVNLAVGYTDMKCFLLENVDIIAYQDLKKEEVNLFLIDFYSDILDQNSTAEAVPDEQIKLSKTGIEFITEYLEEYIEVMIKAGIANAN